MLIEMLHHVKTYGEMLYKMTKYSIKYVLTSIVLFALVNVEAGREDAEAVPGTVERETLQSIKTKKDNKVDEE